MPASDTSIEGVEPTPQEWVARFLALGLEDRLRWATKALDSARDADYCFLANCEVQRIGRQRRAQAPAPTALRERPGDQPLPVPNDHPDVQSMVIADVVARREVGISRYGTALQPRNGRDALRDAYDEALDLATYLRQVIAERDLDAVRPE